MDSNLFWFSDEQWAKIVPHLPTDRSGPKRKDDRRVLSGIMHVLKIDCRWQDCPKDYGPHKTVYNRFSRWSEKGVWQKIFEAVGGPSDPPKQAALDACHIKVVEKWADFQVIGRNKKVHAIVDKLCHSHDIFHHSDRGSQYARRSAVRLMPRQKFSARGEVLFTFGRQLRHRQGWFRPSRARLWMQNRIRKPPSERGIAAVSWRTGSSSRQASSPAGQAMRT